MNRSTLFSKLFLVLFFSLFTQLVFASNINNDSPIAPMLEQVMPSVVNVKAQIRITDPAVLKRMEKEREQKQGPQGLSPQRNTFVTVASGVIVDAKKGIILTNAHVVNEAQTITITLSDGRHFRAKPLGIDKPSDLAVLQIKAKNLKAIKFGNSDNLKVGDFVAAIGNPFGLNQTVTSGIVSALERNTLGIEGLENFIQTDASINPGNSGGALIDENGELVGINTAILAPQRGNIGIGFAIPANMAKSVMMQLLEYGDVKRGMLGVGAQDLTPELASSFGSQTKKGAAVTMVLPSSPAEQAGLQVGDIITSINDTRVKTAGDVVNAIGLLRVNTKAKVGILRNGKKITLKINLTDAKKRKDMIEKDDPYLYGVGMRDFSATSPIHGNVKGVAVMSVEEGSNAWNSDLRPGDVITTINKQNISNISEMKKVIAQTSDSLLLHVLRGPSAIFLLINKEQS